MPLKFACPQCKNSLTVDEKLAGKNAKCPKCGSAVRIPAAQTQSVASAVTKPATKPATKSATKSATKPADMPTGLANALEELTESDYKRQSPFEAVYSPPKSLSSNSEILKRATKQHGAEPKKQSTGMPLVLALYATQNLIQSIPYFALAVLVLVASSVLGKATKEMPFFAGGPMVAGFIFGLLAVVMMVTAIGLFSQRIWGYVVACSAYVMFCFLHIATIIGNTDDRNRWIGASITLVITVFLTTYYFRRRCLGFYKIKTWHLPVIAACSGAVLGIAIGGILLGFGLLGPAQEAAK